MSASTKKFDHLNSPQHVAWNRQRKLRKRMGPYKAWRQFLGLALLPDLESLVQAGDRAFTCLTAGIMADLPVGFVKDPVMSKRPVTWIAVANAKAVAGKLQFDFRGGWDFRFVPQPQPFGSDTLDSVRDALLFTTFNAVDKKVTESAMYTRSLREGGFINKAWAQKRPDDAQELYPTDPESWMPVPYVRITAQQRQDSFELFTQFKRTKSLQCKNCDALSNVETYSPVYSGDEKTVFRGTCPGCGAADNYVGTDVKTANGRPHYTTVFKASFNKDVALGLPIRAPEPMTFVGHEDRGDLRVVKFVSLGGNEYVEELGNDVSLPALNSEFDTGDTLYHLLEQHRNTAMLAANSKLGVKRQWAAARDLFPTREVFYRAVRLWCKYQAVRVDREENYLFPLRMSLDAFRDVPGEEILWDLTDALEHLDEEVGAIVPPPVLQSREDKLSFNAVGVDFSLSDPRFKTE